MIKKINANKLIRIFGFFLITIALMFVGKSAWSQREFLLRINIKMILVVTLVGVLVYLLAIIVVVVAWKMLLNWFGENHLDLFTSIKVYGRSQILKYIPGNLFSLPGRHMLSLQHGAEHGPLVGAATFEIFGMLATASSISILGIVITKEKYTSSSLFLAFAILLITFTSPLVLKYILSHDVVLRKMPVFKTMRWGEYPQLIAIWLLYLCFFVLTGFVLLWTIRVTIGRWSAISMSTALFAFAISWFLGTITPGAPAGAGIRESVIILILSGYIGASASTLVSLIMRIITMLGDVTFYFICLYLDRNFLNTDRSIF